MVDEHDATIAENGDYATTKSQKEATAIAGRIAMMGAMTDTAQYRRDALKAFMRVRNLKPAPFARNAGVAESTIRNFLAARSEFLGLATYQKLAEHYAVSVAALTGETRDIAAASPKSALPAVALPIPEAWREKIATMQATLNNALQQEDAYWLGIAREAARGLASILERAMEASSEADPGQSARQPAEPLKSTPGA